MKWYSIVLVVLVAIEFLYIMYLETFATTSKVTAKVFNLGQAELERKTVNTLFKNQGIYNGSLSLGILYATFISSASREINMIILIYIIIVAIYGSITSDKKIILKQGGLAILALISLFV